MDGFETYPSDGTVRKDYRVKQPMPDFVPPFWSEKAFGVARGLWDPPNSCLRGGNIKPTRMIELENRIRDEAHRRRPPRVQASVFVHKLLEARDEGGAPNFGKTAVKGVMVQFPKLGTITVSNFVKVLRRKLHVSLDREEAVGFFKLYGHDQMGRMPYEVFVRRLFGGDAKATAKKGFKQGAYVYDRPETWGWDGMIRYPMCKNGVFPPSNWPLVYNEACALSKDAPEAYLKVEHLYGFAAGWAPNLFYNKYGDVVYYAAGVGVVYDDNTNKQRYFLRHDDDIECLALHPDRETVASGQFGIEPSVWIWSSGDVGCRGWTTGAMRATTKTDIATTP